MKAIKQLGVVLLPTIFDLANAFLSIEPMSNKKLQKMCYYAQAWHLALEDEPLLKETSFEAWVHGPVNPKLYHYYKDYGYDAITIKDIVIPVDILAFAKQVHESYGHLDAYELECLAHQEAPWKEARGNLRPWEPCNTVISEASMKEYYRSKIAA